MGRETFSRTAYTGAAASVREKSGGGPVTKDAERQAIKTGKLNPLVDPAGYGVIRPSRPRLEQLESGLWQLSVGPPMAIETRVDTTGSMGGNVDIAFSVLPQMYEACKYVLAEYDIQIATGIFGDVSDKFPLCRPQFEMLADRIVNQLSLMVPERAGGDNDEDPHYGLFGGAYLTDFRINKWGLKSYDFTVSDAAARDRLDETQLLRIFGPEVFQKVTDNGFQIKKSDLPSTKEVVQDLLKRAHAFFLQVGDDGGTARFWRHVFPKERVVQLPSTEVLPQMQALIIGLTEGTLELEDCEEFLKEQKIERRTAGAMIRAVANIPLAAQPQLPNYKKLPLKGALFVSKEEIWPVDPAEAKAPDVDDKAPDKKKKGKKGKLDWL